MIVYGEPHSPLPPRVAQRLEQGTHNLLVVGSNPTPRIVSTRLRRTISLPVHAHRTGVLAPPVVGRSFQLRGVTALPPTRLSKANAESELAMAVTAPYRSSKDAIEAIRKFFGCKYYRPPRGQNLASGHIS